VPGKTLVWAIYAGAIYLDCPDDAELQRTGSHMAFPDERVAVVVLTNQDSVDTSAALTFTPPTLRNDIASRIAAGYTKKQLHRGQRLHVAHECPCLDVGSSAPRSGGG
jgi:hypothetical protein